jgi:hypothetical protein
MNKVERIIRVIVGLVIIGWGVIAKNWWGAIGILPLFTGIVGWCGLYKIMGGKSCCMMKKPGDEKKEDKPQTGCCGR